MAASGTGRRTSQCAKKTAHCGDTPRARPSGLTRRGQDKSGRAVERLELQHRVLALVLDRELALVLFPVGRDLVFANGRARGGRPPDFIVEGGWPAKDRLVVEVREVAQDDGVEFPGGNPDLFPAGDGHVGFDLAALSRCLCEIVDELVPNSAWRQLETR